MGNTNIPVTKIHSYNVSVAADAGINAAVLFYNICYWVEENTSNERNCVNGEYWTYNTVNAFKTLFPEMSYEQVRNALRKLENKGYIKSAFLNDDTRDRTKWYTVCDKDKWIISNKCNCENSQMEDEKPTDHNNIYNNKNADTDNKQTDNNITDITKADTLSNDNGKVDTAFPKKSLPTRERKKTKSELKELEADMIKRFCSIGSQYDVSEIVLKNVFNAFKRYLERYTEKTGKVHPILKDETLERVFTALATISDTAYGHFENIAEYEPDSNGMSYLDEIVDEFFKIEHGGETDYHITHFANSEYLEKLANHVIDW